MITCEQKYLKNVNIIMNEKKTEFISFRVTPFEKNLLQFYLHLAGKADLRESFVQLVYNEVAKNAKRKKDSFLNEILDLHDLSRDLQAGSMEDFKVRSQANFTNRALHHHVFSRAVLIILFKYVKLEPLYFKEFSENFIITGQKIY